MSRDDVKITDCIGADELLEAAQEQAALSEAEARATAATIQLESLKRDVLDPLRAQRDDARAALAKVNEIRNSIIGAQTINWSEHIYPLVAVLDAAGIEGMPYPEARKNVGMMLERTNAAEAERDEARRVLREVLDSLDDINGWRPTALQPGGVLYDRASALVALPSDAEDGARCTRCRQRVMPQDFAPGEPVICSECTNPGEKESDA